MGFETIAARNVGKAVLKAGQQSLTNTGKTTGRQLSTAAETSFQARATLLKSPPNLGQLQNPSQLLQARTPLVNPFTAAKANPSINLSKIILNPSAANIGRFALNTAANAAKNAGNTALGHAKNAGNTALTHAKSAGDAIKSNIAANGKSGLFLGGLKASAPKVAAGILSSVGVAVSKNPELKQQLQEKYGAPIDETIHAIESYISELDSKIDSGGNPKQLLELNNARTAAKQFLTGVSVLKHAIQQDTGIDGSNSETVKNATKTADKAAQTIVKEGAILAAKGDLKPGKIGTKAIEVLAKGQLKQGKKDVESKAREAIDSIRPDSEETQSNTSENNLSNKAFAIIADFADTLGFRGFSKAVLEGSLKEGKKEILSKPIETIVEQSFSFGLDALSKQAAENFPEAVDNAQTAVGNAVSGLLLFNTDSIGDAEQVLSQKDVLS